MALKGFFEQFNIFGQCRKYRLPLWHCPQFLFVVMGTIIIATAVVTYILGTRYVADPDTVSLIVLTLTIILFVVTFSIIRSMEGLAEANRLKSEFISVVSHQLRSPISNLKWSLELLLSGKLGEIQDKQSEYFRILEENTARMSELVSDLLVVSRIEQGRLPLNKTEFSLEELTEEVIAKFVPYARASNVEIKIEAEKSLARAFADRHQVKSVIENLLDNAIRYIKESGRIEIKIQEKRGKSFFEIKDSGVGIPKQDQKHIFQKFFRSQNILKYQTQGSGLGLHIAKFIIKRSGGKIWFHSEEHKGSTFYFTLPIKR